MITRVISLKLLFLLSFFSASPVYATGLFAFLSFAPDPGKTAINQVNRRIKELRKEPEYSGSYFSRKEYDFSGFAFKNFYPVADEMGKVSNILTNKFILLGQNHADYLNITSQMELIRRIEIAAKKSGRSVIYLREGLDIDSGRIRQNILEHMYVDAVYAAKISGQKEVYHPEYEPRRELARTHDLFLEYEILSRDVHNATETFNCAGWDKPGQTFEERNNALGRAINFYGSRYDHVVVIGGYNHFYPAPLAAGISQKTERLTRKFQTNSGFAIQKYWRHLSSKKLSEELHETLRKIAIYMTPDEDGEDLFNISDYEKQDTNLTYEVYNHRSYLSTVLKMGHIYLHPRNIHGNFHSLLDVYLPDADYARGDSDDEMERKNRQLIPSSRDYSFLSTFFSSVESALKDGKKGVLNLPLEDFFPGIM